MIMMAISFLCLRNEPNLDVMKLDGNEGSIIGKLLAYIFIGSLLLVPVPIFMFNCCKSSYYVIQNREDGGVLDGEAVYDDTEQNLK